MKQDKKALEQLRQLRTGTPQTRSECLTDTAVAEQCLAFSCKYNITGGLAFYDPVEALQRLIDSNDLELSNNEIRKKIIQPRDNCILDFLENGAIHTTNEIADILGIKKGKIDRILSIAERKYRMEYQNRYKLPHANQDKKID